MFNEKSKDRQSFKKWATHQGPRLAACPHTATEERVYGRVDRGKEPTTEGKPVQGLTPAKPGGRGGAGSGRALPGACQACPAESCGLWTAAEASDKQRSFHHTTQPSLSSPLAGPPQARGRGARCRSAQWHRTGGQGQGGDCRERSAWGKRERASISTKNTGVCPKKPRTGGAREGCGSGVHRAGGQATLQCGPCLLSLLY